MDRPEQKSYSLPLGLVNSMAQRPDAMEYFCSLPGRTQNEIVSYIQVSATGEEAKQRTRNAVQGLESHNLNFLG